MKHHKKILSVLLVLLISSCGSMTRKGDPGLFHGNFQVGGSAAIVFPIYEAYEIEFQTSSEPILFFFDKKTDEGLYKYNSDDESMYFLMNEDHQGGTFYEITEPPMQVVKEE